MKSSLEKWIQYALVQETAIQLSGSHRIKEDINAGGAAVKKD